MKKTYSTPSVHFKSIRLNENISDICWAYATGHIGKKIYWDANSSKPGYVQFYFQTKISCGKATEGELGSSIVVEKWLEDFTSATAAELAIIALPSANSAEPFKGSPFSTTPPTS